MLLEPRSLILISKEAYQYFHGIAEVKEDIIDDNIFNQCINLSKGMRLDRSTRYLFFQTDLFYNK